MDDREDKPRLGTADKAGVVVKGDESPGVKPYAGRGGMKKLLYRRRLEEEEELEKAKSSNLEIEVEEQTRKTANELDLELQQALQPSANAVEESELPAPVSSIGGREQPSMRVGRVRTGRNHIMRPMMRGRPGRFSAIEEVDEDETMEESNRPNELKKFEPTSKPPTSQPPPGFSFAKPVSSVLLCAGITLNTLI
jgi:nucleoporin NUP1